MENKLDIVQLSKSKIAKDSAIVLAGNMLSAGLGFIATILITRTLDPAQFGLFSVALAVMGIASQFSDFGVSTGMVRFASLYLKNDNQKANLIFKVSLKLKLIITTLVFLIGFFASESLAVNVFGNLQLIFLLKLAFIGAFGASLAAYIGATLQARQSFKKFTLINLIAPVGKIALIGLLFLTYKLNLLSALTTVIILPFIAFLIGSLIIPKDFLKVKGDENEALHDLFHFSKWILVLIFCVMIFQRLDVLMLGYFKVAEEVGYYSAAFGLTSALTILTGSFTVVLLPEISKLTEKDEIKRYIRKVLKVTTILAMLLLPLIFIAKPFILTIYGVEYLGSVIIFKLLCLNTMFILIAHPITLVIYSINKPEISAYVSILQLLANFLGNFLLIPSYGAIGAAITTMITSVGGSFFIMPYIYYKIYKSKITYKRNNGKHKRI